MDKLKAAIVLARPHQYTKNIFIWAPAFFGYRLTDPAALWSTFWAFVCFCLISSAVYTLNDLRDVEEDRNHPKKRNRPLASGALSPRDGVLMMAVLAISSLTLSLIFLNGQYLLILAVYVALNIGYSFYLKRFAVVDVVCIALGFVLRVFAGGVVTGIAISHWLVVMVFLLALFLALAKRLDDLRLNESGNAVTRKSISGYNLLMVRSGMNVMMSVIIVSYLLYTTSPEAVAKHGTDKLYLTSFWVIVGLLRYLQISLVDERSGSPTLVLIKDPFIRIVVAFWILTFYILIYVHSG